jgi:ceramide glucosyltransferase
MAQFGALLFLPALAYQLVSLVASIRQYFRKTDQTSNADLPPVSILKPVRGLDPAMTDALRSQAEQQYPNFEILFGVSDPADPAIPLIRQLQSEFPSVAISLHIGSEPAMNAKVGTLSHLAKFARHPVWLVNDSDIHVTPDYLSTVVAPLSQSSVGVVTCLYRPLGHSPAANWEAFGIAIDFMPSTLVAQLLGVREFGLGSTLCFRAADLMAAGGFPALADYIADDYQLASRLVKGGRKAHLSSYVVDTSLGDASWRGIWQHQLRWARTIRATKGAGFAGLPITHACVWAVLAGCLKLPYAAAALVIVRIAAALASGWLVIGLRRSILWALLAPVWDLYAFAVWIVSYTSRNVIWRDRLLRIHPSGRLERREP